MEGPTTIIALGIAMFVIPFCISMLICRCIAIGKAQTLRQEEDNAFWMVVLICVPIILIAIGYYLDIF